MPIHNDISSLPPATLRAALVASEKREEKEKLRREIRKLQKRLDELEEPGDTSEVELVRNVASGSRHKVKRLRVDSSSDEEVAQEMRNRRWPIARARRVDPIPVSPQRYVHSGGGILVMTRSLQSIVHGMSKEGCSLSVGRQLQHSEVSRLPSFKTWMRYEAPGPR